MNPDDIAAIARQVREHESRHRAVCASKRIFRSEEAAARAAADKSSFFGEPMYYYQCPVCSQYHLTRQAQNR